MATVVPALGAPEGAVVAGFERIDLIARRHRGDRADGVEPDRAPPTTRSRIAGATGRNLHRSSGRRWSRRT
jgi:hypothetical protein